MSYLAVSPVVLVRSQTGNVDYHYPGLNPHIPWLSDEQRERFLAEGHVVEAGDPGPASVVEGAGDPGASTPDPSGKPAKTAAVEKWLDYGVSQGHNRDELSTLTKPELVELLG